MRTVVLVLISLACAACNGDGSFDSTSSPESSGTVGTAGGTVEVTSGRLAGTKVVVPAGALAEDVQITITSSSTNVTLAGFAVGGPAVRFGPAGLTFAAPVTVTIPYTGSSLGLEVAHRDDASGVVSVLPNPVLDGSVRTATVTVTSFSTLQCLLPVEGELPTYDADGAWVFRTSNNVSTPAGSERDDEVAVGSIDQNGNNVTISIGDSILPGTVSGASYTVVASEQADGGTLTETITFTMTTSSAANGTVAWTWTDGTTTVTGSADLELERQLPETYDVTGVWDFEVSQSFSDPVGSEDPAETVVVPMAQTDGTFSLTTDSGQHGGNVSGASYFVAWTEADATSTRQNWVEFTLTSASAGTGTLRWRSVDELGAVVTGGATLTLTRQP